MTIEEQTPGQKRSPAVERFNAKCRFERARADLLGLEIQPSVNGPYLVKASTDKIVASPRSNAYHAVLYAGEEMPKSWRA